MIEVKATGSATPIQKPRRQLLTRPVTARQPIAPRPVTHAENIGLVGDASAQSRQLFSCWRMLSRDNTPEFIAKVTGLSEAFIRAMEARFQGE
jgi:hypothetical protein